MCLGAFVSPCAQGLPRSSHKTGTSANVCGRAGGGAREASYPESGCFLVELITHPTLGLQVPAPGHRLGAMHAGGQAVGKVPCRGAVSIPREGGASSRSGRWRRKPGPSATAVAAGSHPSAPASSRLGWPTVAACLATFCSALSGGRALAGGWTKGARVSMPSSSPLSSLTAWPLGHSLQNPPKRLCIKLIPVMGGWRGRGHLWKPQLSTQTLALAGDVMEGQWHR